MNVRIAGGMNVISIDKRQFWSLVGIGFILGSFSNLAVFLRFGVDALWALSVFGICVLIMFFLQRVSHPVSKSKSSSDGESKTLVGRVRSWSK